MRRFFVGLCIIALLAAAACAPKGVTCPDGTYARSVAECPGAQQSPTQPQTPPSPTVVAQMLPAIQQLIDLHNVKVQSYSFVYAPIELLKSGPTVSPGSTYNVRGTKVRVDVWHSATATVIATSNIDTVYLDTATKKIHAYCMSQEPATCSIKGDPRPANYEDYAIKLPLDWLADIPANATLSSSITFQDHDTQRIRYAIGGKYYELLIDTYSGVPLRIRTYSDPDYLTLIGGAEYQQFTINYIKEADVTPPS
jgi:hypothetical protein